jgi:hypothetical protein
VKQQIKKMKEHVDIHLEEMRPSGHGVAMVRSSACGIAHRA